MQFLNRLKLWQKLALLVGAMAVPTALLGSFYLSGANTQVALASDEIEGARYVQSVGAVLAEASNHRSRLFALLTGDAARRDEVSSLRERDGQARFRRGCERRQGGRQIQGVRSLADHQVRVGSSQGGRPEALGRRSRQPSQRAHRSHLQVERDHRGALRTECRSVPGDFGSHPDRHPQRAERVDRLGQHPLVRDSRQHQGLPRR